MLKSFVKKRIIIIFSLLAMLLLSSGFIAQQLSSEQLEIEKLIKNAVNTTKSINQLPDQFLSNPNEKIPRQVKEKMYEKISFEFNKIYSSDSEILKRRIDSLKGTISWQESDNFRALGGGIKKVENLIININGNNATANVDITSFVKIKESNGKIFTPEGSSHYKFNLVKEENTWKISEEIFDVTSGAP
ncbi:MAG: hypothetical protein WA131_10835 [Desulfitobacteriaceae bacterium]